jgi:MFS family permease
MAPSTTIEIEHTAEGSTEMATVTPPKVLGTSGTLLALIAVASVANFNLAVANVAIPEIGLHFAASQTQLNLVSVGFSLGLASTVLYLGAFGDRYGRKLMLVLGMILTIPAALLAAWSPSIEILFAARLIGGVAAGMAFPTTLALITALWDGAKRTKAIALWSAIGGAMIAVAMLVAGDLLTVAWWGSWFAITAPLALVALVLAVIFVPAHINETTEPVDHLGGVLSIIGILALVLAINFAAESGKGRITIISAVVAVAMLAAFFARQRRYRDPLFDLHIASRRIFWVAAIAGMIIFGTLMGGVFVGAQFLQQVLNYSTLKAGLAVIPAAVAMIFIAPYSAKLIERFGSRVTLLIGYVFLFFAFLSMLLLWNQNSHYWQVGLAFVLIGAGVGLAGTPASHSLTGSVPVRRAGMASGTADLQRDLGGSIMQSILGAILAAGYSAAVATQIKNSGQTVPSNVTTILEKSYASAATFAQGDPQNSAAIIAGAKTSFLQGANWAYSAGSILIVCGAILVWFMFPKKNEELKLLGEYEAQDSVSR